MGLAFLDCPILIFSLLGIRGRGGQSRGGRRGGGFERKRGHVLTLSELSVILEHSG